MVSGVRLGLQLGTHMQARVFRTWSSCPAHVYTYLRLICCRAKEVLKLIKIDDTRNLGK